MFRGTTPVIKWKINSEDIDFDEIEEIWFIVKYRNNQTMIFKKDNLILDAEEGTISYQFLQEETLKFNAEQEIQCQLRLLINGNAFATSITEIDIEDVLKGGVIS